MWLSGIVLSSVIVICSKQVNYCWQNVSECMMHTVCVLCARMVVCLWTRSSSVECRCWTTCSELIETTSRRYWNTCRSVHELCTISVDTPR